MTRSGRRAVFANPFFVLLMLSSTAFALTALAYAVSPFVVLRAERTGGAWRPEAALGSEEAARATRLRPPAAAVADSTPMVDWLNRRGPFVLGLEITLMIVTGTVAMLTDRWFSGPSPAPRS